MGGECLPEMNKKRFDIHNEIKAMIIRQGWTLTRVVNAMNELHPERKKTTVQNISNKLTRGTIKYAEVLEIAQIIGLRCSWDESNNTKGW